MAQVAAPSLSPPSNAYIAGNVDGGGEGAQLTQKTLPQPVPAGKQVGAVGSLALSTSHRPTGSRLPLRKWWQGRGGEGEVICTPGGI